MIRVIPGGKLLAKRKTIMLKELIAYCEPSLEPPKVNLKYRNPQYIEYLAEKYGKELVEEFCEKYNPQTSTNDWRH